MTADNLTRTQQLIVEECDRIKAMLLGKNRSYGNSAIEPVSIFSRASAQERMNVRLDDKLNRIMRGEPYPGDNDTDDMIGYLLLKNVERRFRQDPPVNPDPIREEFINGVRVSRPVIGIDPAVYTHPDHVRPVCG